MGDRRCCCCKCPCLRVDLSGIVDADCWACEYLNAGYYLPETSTCTWSSTCVDDACNTITVQAALTRVAGTYYLTVTLDDPDGDHVWQVALGSSMPDCTAWDRLSLAHVSSGSDCDSSSATCCVTAVLDTDPEHGNCEGDCLAWELTYCSSYYATYKARTLGDGAGPYADEITLAWVSGGCPTPPATLTVVRDEVNDTWEVAVAGITNPPPPDCSVCDALNGTWLLSNVSPTLWRSGAVGSCCVGDNDKWRLTVASG